MLLYEEIKKVCKMINDKKPCLSQQRQVINKFKKQWKLTMAYSGLYNAMKFTYSPNRITLTNYGLKTNIYIVPPLTFAKLEAQIEMLQENFGCLIIFNHSKVSPFINAKFIFNPQDTIIYKVVKQKYPWEIYIGNDYAGVAKLVDVSKYVHVGEYGGTRSGKSVQQSIIITNLVANISPKDLNLYLIQVAKNDLILFKACEHTKAFAHTLEETLQVLEYIVNIDMPRRSKLIEPYRECAKANSYRDYNKLKFTEKMVLSYVIFDETSSLFQEQNNAIKKIKDQIVFYMEEIARYGASLGYVLLVSLQRPTRDNLSPIIKSQCTTTISFRQNNSKSSEVSIDDAKCAMGLEAREFVYRLASKNIEYGIVPWVEDLELQEIIKPFKKPHRTLFEDLNKMQSIRKDKQRKEKVEPIQPVPSNFKTEKEFIKENTNKIKDYVPYNNYNGMTLVKPQTKQGKERIK